jgi:hypothetical protein
VTYTPNDNFRGEDQIAVAVVTPQGQTQQVVVAVGVGKKQKLITQWSAPKRLKQGMNWFGPGTFMTNAHQMATVSADCSALLRVAAGKPAPSCTVIAGKEGTYIDIKVYEPTGIEVTISASKKGKYAPLEEKFFYRVSP